MERTQIVSMRLDKELVQKIEMFIQGRPYWSRTLLVNRLLTALFSSLHPKIIAEIMMDYDPYVDAIAFNCRIIHPQK